MNDNFNPPPGGRQRLHEKLRHRRESQVSEQKLLLRTTAVLCFAMGAVLAKPLLWAPSTPSSEAPRKIAVKVGQTSGAQIFWIFQ